MNETAAPGKTIPAEGKVEHTRRGAGGRNAPGAEKLHTAREPRICTEGHGEDTAYCS